MTQDMNHTITKVLKAVLVAAMMSLAGGNALAQVKVKGNVYGGGNAADVQTNTVVNISAGSVEGNVYGGGNLGDVGTIDKADINNYIWSDYTDTDTNNDTGICTVNISGGTIGAENKSTANHASGHVFGAGKGSGEGTYYCEQGMVYKTSVTISKATVYGNVYGGGQVGRVENNTTVKIGADTGEDVAEIKGSVFGAGAGLETHGYSALVRNNTNVTVQGYAKVRNNVYGGGEIAAVGRYWVYTDPLPAGAPPVPTGATLGLPYQQRSGGICTVNVKDHAEIGPEEGAATETAGHVFGAGKGVTPNYISGTSKKMPPTGGELVDLSSDEYTEFLESLALATNTSVTIGGSATGTDTKVKGSVYGGSENGFVQHNTSVSIQSGSTIGTENTETYGDVYGGGKGLPTFAAAGRVSRNSTVTINGGTTYGSVYGGGAYGIIKGAVDVTVTGGEVKNDVYGGGALADTNTENWNGSTLVSPYHEETGLTVGTSVVTGLYTRSGSAEPYTYTEIKTADQKAADGITYYRLTDTKVKLTGGTVRDVYGGGLGRKVATGVTAIEAMVYGDVLVDLNGTTTYDTNGTVQTNPINTKGCIVNRVFGCNNVNGTPKGEVLVHVHATQSSASGKETVAAKSDKNTNAYDVQAIYGGGNQAEYYPVRADDTETEANHVHTNVIIDGCLLSSIETVYGGGNAASTPSTCVTVNGAYEIGEVFGGGNGASTTTFTNPGANVGFHHYITDATNAQTVADRATNYGYGFGKAQVNIGAGTIHAVYGGSNSKGNVRKVAIATLDHLIDGCSFEVGEAYGGGKSADMDGQAILQLGCVPSIGEVYGGARDANVNDNVVLTITNGTYNRVFGGNNEGGKINGTITVNIEETGCKPIVIGQLFGGGNQAAYEAPFKEGSTTEREDGPTLNIKSFTSIGEIYGGGYSADVTGDVQVNINEVLGDNKAVDSPDDGKTVTLGGHDVVIPAHTANALGVIGNIYGGGYGADVMGDVEVNICKVETIDYVSKAPGETTPRTGIAVVGANITGSVYGGGYGPSTTVTGNVAVNIGGEKTEGSTTTYIGGNITIGGSVYGGSALGAVNASTTKDATTGNITAYTPTDNATTTVTLKKGTVSTAVFGGGMGNANTQAKVYGKAVVNFYGDVISQGLYGGCDFNGKLFNGTELNLLGGRIGDAFTAVPNTGVPEIVFGGGLGELTIVEGAVDVNVGTATTPGSCTIYSNVYGGSKNGSVAVANVNLLGGTIWGNVFGGGYQTADGKTAATNVNVTLDGTKFVCLYSGTGTDAIPQTGQIFGCNNLQGSPTGHVKVWVKKTVDSTKDGNAAVSARTTYDVAAVYGGGNKANYEPTSTSESTEVFIEGCQLTSIKDVYGGGNAAAVPASNVTVIGSYIINRLFGGGNGFGTDNPGADVGYHKVNGSRVEYGTGKATTKLYGGYINSVFGGSNSKGDIKGDTDVQTKKIGETVPDGNSCANLIIGNLYGAGSQADVDGDVTIYLDCLPDDYVGAVYGGAEQANINGSVSLTVTSGKFGRVFGGNNAGGNIKGSITVNILEGGCKPLEIGELFGGGNAAPYSIYGCTKTENTNGTFTWTPNTTGTSNLPEGKEYAIEVNVYACTSIGKVFGGGYGESAKVIGDTRVNINMMKGYVNDQEQATIGHIGQVYGGGSAAEVIGNTTVDIGTATANAGEDIGVIITKTKGELGSDDYKKTRYLHPETDSYIALDGAVYGGGMNAKVDGNTTINIGTAIQNLGTTIDGSVYGGGKEGDVTGNTQVNICAKENTSTHVYERTLLSDAGVTITGDVYGGGKGVAAESGDRAFYCEKAMVGKDGDGIEHPDGGTTVIIGNGTVNGTVYGGGEVGRVEKNTVVTIGLGIGDETVTSTSSAPEIKGSVFGGGKGKETHGYAALVRGNPTVTVQGNAKVRQSVYGGGEIASVARYQLDANGEPQALMEVNGHYSGYCTVTIGGYAEIGPATGMKMYHSEITDGTDKPDDWGHVFGAGKGILPKVYTYQGTDKPYRIGPDDEKEYYDTEAGYFKFIQTQALASQTNVTIDDHAFVKGSVYGGSENGLVQYNTKVTINNGQIGAGDGVNRRYTETEWGSESLAECASWKYEAPFAPYDPNANATGALDKYPLVTGQTEAKSTEGGRRIATDGHTYYGNVFGGGSGSIPYFDTQKGISRYIMTAGQVKGDATVNINGGHILTNVYGGCEATNVLGIATVKMTGGTIGVPRSDNDIIAHPVTGYLFGAGKGDQRVFFNKDTNVKDAKVTVEGGRIYGSVYGGGEDGHVLRNTEVTITGSTTKIGTKGTSYYDGHVFGGGRGFGGDALTAGNVGGSVTLTIEDGSILGSVYGGGRLASVGYGLYLTTEDGYGKMRADNEYDGSYTNPSTEEASTFFNKGRGHIIMNISGGTIGNDSEYAYDANNELTHTKGGNVFAGGMGNFYKQDGVTYIDALDWWKLGSAKSTKLTISGNTKIKSCVYGGGELGQVVGSHATTNAAGDNINIGTEVIINGGTIGTEIKDGETVKYTFGSVFGGGYGSLVEQVGTSYPKYIAGRVKGGTKVNMTAGTVRASVYGGGEMAAVGESVVLNETLTEGLTGDTHVMISGGTIGKDKVVSGEKTTYFGGAKMGNVYGGGSGHNNTVRSGHVYGNTNVTISGTDTRIYHNVYGGGAYGSVGEFVYSTGTDAQTGTQKVNGISGRHTDRANTGVATVAITGGTIGIDGKENGMVFGSSRGDINKPGERDDHTAWVYDAHVTIGTQGSETGPNIKGSLYGSGENGHTFNDVVVSVHSGTIGVADDPSYPYRGNVYGGGCGTDKYYSNTEGVANPRDGNGDKYNPLAGIVYGNATINIDGGTVVHNVYGAGAMGSVGKSAADGSVSGGKTTINISGGTIGVSGNVEDGNVYGAARGDLSATGDDLAQVQQSEVIIKPNTIEGKPEATVKGSVFGGGQAGIVKGSVKVEMTGGNVNQDVYGGGALANTQTSNWDATKNGGTGDWADAEKKSALHKTLVNLVGGTIGGYAYGGGLGRVASTGVTPIEAYVYGDVTVKLNEGKAATDKGCIVDKIFGCNNLNGTPKGHVQVYVYATQNKNASYSTIGSNKTDALRHTGMEAEGVETTYDLSAVYGGGNLAPYDPVDAYSTDETVKAAAQSEVYINGCDLTSIKQVYGGGNAAPAPATYVRVDGVYEIEELFGGGNGKDDYVIDGKYYDNPGANVGYKNYTHLDGTGDGSKTSPFNCVDNDNATTKEGRQTAANNYMYGSGVAHVEVFGGKIHASYGGSNEKGNISIKAWSKYEEGGTCDLDVPETYGGGKNSLIDGEIVLDIGCTTYMPVIYGGSKDADVNSDIVLNITNGKYDQVFGGNNHSGNINGSITVNIKENGCVPIEIGELYLGGYLADYSIYGYKTDGTIRTKAEYDALSEAEKEAITVRKFPRINVISATKIGDIYGGGYQATVVGDPHINVNMEQGRVLVSKILKEGTTDEYIYKDGKNTEYATDVYTIETAGDNHYAILPIGTIGNIYGGGNMADIIGDTYVEIGTGTYHNDNGDIVTITPTRNAAHITGDVFGGGNNADVTGNTHVIICANENTSTGKWQGVAEGSANVTIQGTHPEGGFGRGVFGGGNKGEVKSDSYVYLGGGSVNETIYGGGCEADVKGNTYVTMLGGYVFDGVCGGGLKGSVGTYNKSTNVTDFGHTANHTDCIGKPTECTSGGTCTVVISGGQVGPVELATEGMTGANGPVSEGWVWGAGRGVVEDPSADQDTHFKTYVNNTDVTISGDAFIVGSIIGGGEFGRVLGNTLVKIEGGQIGVGEGKAADGKPVRYTEDQWVAAETAVRTGNASGINAAAAAMPACSHFDYGKVVDGKTIYETYDPYAKDYPTLYPGGSTTHASDGKTWIGCVFGGGSGYFPYKNSTGYDWVGSAGLVEGNTEVRISGGHILTNVYGGNEYTSVNGTSKVTMTGGTIGVPRTLDQIEKDPMIGYLFGAGKGDPRPHFDTFTNVGNVDVEVAGGIIFGSVYGGSEDGHVLGDVKVTVKKNENSKPDPIIGTWGTSYVDGNVFGGGRGFSGENVKAGAVGGKVDIAIEGGTMLGSVYGGGRMGSVDDNITIAISGGTIGNDWEYNYNPDNKLSHTKGGNVFAGSMGSLYKQDGSTNSQWQSFAHAKQTKVTISGADTKIKSCVYGGGELGSINENTEIKITGGTIGSEIGTGDNRYYFGSVFGGGYGSTIEFVNDEQNGETNPKLDAGIVHGSTKITMEDGKVMASVYGGGEVASVEGSTDLAISGGTIGVSGFGGIEIGNVYGGGKGDKNIVRAGHIFGNTKVQISEAEGKTTQIWHNVYGGGAYGTVGDFEYETEHNAEFGTDKVTKVKGLKEGTTGGTAEVIITGGTIGRNGKENGMVFGSSRGDVGAPGSRDDLLAWTYDTKVTIGTSGSDSGPAIKGSVYGGGENGHNFNDADVTIHSGTIGIAEGEAIDSYSGAAYPYRGNVYGAGCGTDKYYSGEVPTGHTATDGEGDKYNPLAGIVYGNTTITMDGGQVVHNIYGAGAMGSVGITNADGTISGGQTTIKISDGTIGVNGTAGDGNVFGAARGDADATSNEFALVRKNTSVSVTGGNVKGNVYGGGELGCVGVYTMSSDMRTFTWKDTDGNDNTAANSNNKNTGLCNVTIDGSSAVINGNVFGAGKGKDDTFWCEKGIAYSTNVSVANGTVKGNVYGGGELGRVETDTKVKIGDGAGTEGGTIAPTITGSVFGGGAGLETHGYSALVRGNTTVTVEGNAGVGHSVYGGGEIASVGKYGLDAQKMPSILQGGGYCYVSVKGHAEIGEDVFGAGKGITPHFDKDNTDLSKRSRRMTLKNGWESLEGDARFDWDYLQTESAYSTYLETLALATHPEVTIDESAKISGSVFGGGELGLTKGSVIVNIKGGTIAEDVYGGGSLANTNTTNTVDLDGDGVTETVNPTTTVNLYGGLIKGDAYGGGLGQLGTNPIEAKVYGDVNVTLDGSAFNVTYYTDEGHTDVVKSGRIFGCNNLNGSPQGNVTVTINKTVAGNKTRTALGDLQDEDATKHHYEVAGVYGGGNLADYTPKSGAVKVIINSCEVSAREVYGGGNAAAVPGTDVLVNGAYEIEHVFGGGNGEDDYYLNNQWNTNQGANVGGDAITLLTGGYIHEAYGASNSKGTIFGNINISKGSGGKCDLNVVELYGAGKDADVEGDLIMVMGCSETRTEAVYGCARNANVKGNVELTVTSGEYGKIFGGNNESGAIFGHIIVNIEEDGCSPIIIDELYGCGNDAAYSTYGYYQDGTIEGTDGKPKYVARSANDTHEAVTFEGKPHTVPPYADPEVNIISATRIGKVFGGGLGEHATVYGNPKVNINMIKGAWAGKTYGGTEIPDQLGAIGDVYGGGNAADVEGNTHVNIGTLEKVQYHLSADASGNYTMSDEYNVEGANITGNVFGGGMGKDDTFTCEKAMVGKDGDGVDADGKLKEGGTNVIIGNGTVKGSVYGGGEIGRVERNTSVTIGLESGTGKPVVEGNVFGGGKGLKTHGYSALVRGTATVTIQGDAKVGQSVYGGGEIASVGNFFVKGVNYDASLNAPQAPASLPDGMPYALKYPNTASGTCYVTIRGNAEIGPDNLQMPTFSGNVFGAGKGILPDEYPYEGENKTYTGTTKPQRMQGGNTWDTFTTEPAYIEFIETLGMSAATEVTIDGNAFVKGSVYGGSENGHVLHDTHVTIENGQIGNGNGVNARYTDWTAESLEECASWDYGQTVGSAKVYLPYDVYDLDTNDKPKAASDGHTFYGNVFGGGSGYFPYRHNPAWVKDAAKTAEVGQPVDKNGYSDGLWLRSAGAVYGNTYVDIKGGHILTSVYGGNECTDVGKYLDNSTTPEAGTGICTINMVGGTIGVPRTVEEKQQHPVVGNLFGAGKGDQRINFNTWTNVASTQVNISGTARIYGSSFGGGEDGHIIGNAETNIGGTVTIGTQDYTHSNVIIGTTGTSYSDGNVFGGGRGFSGDAQTAGTVGGNAAVNIMNGTILGSVYGGGRLASVGTVFEFPTLANGNPNPQYGQFREDGDGKTYGHITINISGGTIGNENATGDGAKYSGNVFGGSMGRLELLNGKRNPIWPKMAQVKNATVNIFDNATIIRSVFGGGELGTVRDKTFVTIGGYKTADADADGNVAVTKSGSPTVRRDVFGGGYGSEDRDYTIFTIPELKAANADPSKPESYESHTYAFTPMQFAGCVGQNTYVNVAGGYIRKSVYGGGEMASVGVINYRAAEATSELGADKIKIGPIDGKTYYYENMVKHEDATKEFALSWPYEFKYVDGYEGATHVKVTGGRLGLKEGDDETGFDDNGDVYGAGKGKAGDYKDYVFCANVGSTDVKIAYPSTPTEYSGTADLVAGAVYGGGEDGHVMGDTKLTLTGGLVYHSIYGAGSGKGLFETRLVKIGKDPNSTADADHYTREIYSITAGKVFGNSTVEMSGGYVVRNVYGGGNMGSVGKGNYAGGADDYSTAGYGETLTGNLWDGSNKFSEAFLNSGKCTVKISGGTIGYIDESDPSNSMYPWNSTASLPYGNVFGGCRGESAPNITESPRYLYSPEFFVGYANETDVTIEGDAKILGSVYGGGMDGHIRRDASVTIKGGEIGLTYTDANKTLLKTEDVNNIQWLARGNVYGAGSGIGKYKYDFDYDGKYESTVTYNGRETKEEDYSTSAGSVTRFTKVDIQGGTIHRNVYGGGSLSSIGAPKIPATRTDNPIVRNDSETETKGKQTLNEVIISGGQIGDATSRAADYGGQVFGGSRGDASLNSSTFSTSMFTKLNMAGGKVLGSMFGGGEVGIVKGSVNVDVTGGEVVNDVYGGGALANTNTANPEGVTDQYTTTVNLLGGTINNAFGGGLGQKTGVNGATSDVEAIVYGDVNVNLNGSIVTGNVFGCNNYNGTPLGHAKVHVFKTKAREGQAADDYDVSYVFGGGNNADYVPTDAKQSTEVIIEGCDLTSIYEVYGGGYGAATPGTNVLIKGTKIIDNVFGGGYGAGTNNPGANVGYKTGGTTAYGLGDANTKTAIVQLMAGHVNNVYGGSNTKGDIRGGASITNLANSGEPGTCANLDVEKVYGGGKNAEMAGGTEIILGCMPNDWIEEIYAGAENADVGNDVSLTITSGKFGRVFGGNKTSGRLHGSIVVNIEENPECSTPIIIGELYAGGNEAPYSIYGYKAEKDDKGKWIPRQKSDYDAMSASQKDAEGIGSAPHNGPMLNVRAFTSIGNIFGGGYGESAVMVGSPVVNINEVEGGRAYSGETKTLNDGVQVTLQPRAADGKMGVIGTVFGGGNAAKVIGDTHVNIGTTKTETFESVEDDPATTENEKAKTVVGADIRGNVYGGGNNAAVEGKTNVVIGEEKKTTP